MDVDLRTIKVNRRITIFEPGEYYGVTGIVWFADGNTAKLATIKDPNHTYDIDITNVHHMKYYEEDN